MSFSLHISIFRTRERRRQPPKKKKEGEEKRGRRGTLGRENQNKPPPPVSLSLFYLPSSPQTSPHSSRNVSWMCRRSFSLAANPRAGDRTNKANTLPLLTAMLLRYR